MADVPTPPAATRDSTSAPDSTYTAVLYFHGIGQQRHYEQVCRLIQRLDEHCYQRFASGDPDYRERRFADIVGRLVPWDGGELAKDEADDVVYVRTDLLQPAGKAPAQVRFFEAYWAPEAADAPNALAVTRWLASQVWTPVRVLLAPWRSYERLRRADLVALSRRRRDANPIEAEALIRRVSLLVRQYGEFQKQSARRRYPRGSFREFRAFLMDGRAARDPALDELLSGWRRSHLLRQIRLVLGILSIVTGAVSSVGLFALASYWVIQSLSPALTLAGKPLIEVSVSSVTSLLASILGTLGATRFLSQYVGDVQQFVTYEEAEPLYRRRKAIIASCVKHVRHVLNDRKCTRAVLVCHSLGTAVAVDTMLELRRFNLARNAANPMAGPLPLEKITHLVTMGSPVDKVNYFFGALNSEYRVYECLVDGLRGDIGTPPFSQIGRQPWIHWINYWDRADLISGPIETVAPGILRHQEVDNVRISSFALPAPMASHDGYFRHADVIGDLFTIIFEDGFSYVRARREAALLKARPDLDRERRGPGQGSRLQAALFWILPTVPWLMAGTLLELLVGGPPIFRWLLAGSILVLGSAEWAHGRGYGHLRSLSVSSSRSAPRSEAAASSV